MRKARSRIGAPQSNPEFGDEEDDEVCVGGESDPPSWIEGVDEEEIADVYHNYKMWVDQEQNEVLYEDESAEMDEVVTTPDTFALLNLRRLPLNHVSLLPGERGRYLGNSRQTLARREQAVAKSRERNSLLRDFFPASLNQGNKEEGDDSSKEELEMGQPPVSSHAENGLSDSEEYQREQIVDQGWQSSVGTFRMRGDKLESAIQEIVPFLSLTPDQRREKKMRNAGSTDYHANQYTATHAYLTLVLKGMGKMEASSKVAEVMYCSSGEPGLCGMSYRARVIRKWGEFWVLHRELVEYKRGKQSAGS